MATLRVKRTGLPWAAMFGATLLIAMAHAGVDPARPTAIEARTAYDMGARFVDVRTDAEWSVGHLRGAVHLPLDQIKTNAAAALPEKRAELILYCASGKRAQSAVDILRQLGYQHVIAMQGGYDDLKAAGYPVAP